MKLDILVFAVHPDDAELGCCGTILKHIAEGKKVGLVDLTRGELGTRGTAESRDEEAANSAVIMGLHARENLGMRDAFFKNDEAHQLQIIRIIRKYQPEIILCNALRDRHPDHGRASDLVSDSVFFSGLPKVITEYDNEYQTAHRPSLLLHYIQDKYIKPDVVVDVTEFWETKMDCVRAFKTQFYTPELEDIGQQTYISSPEFLYILEGRAREYGKNIGCKFAEGFTCDRILGVKNLFDLL